METKAWYKSKTAWIAILQSISGFLAAIVLFLQEGYSPEAMTALGLGLKGLLDLKLRYVTKTAIE